MAAEWSQTTAYKTVLSTLQANATIQRLGGVIENSLMNPMKSTNEWSARFPMKLFIFGDTQVDGAGVKDELMFFAVFAKMKLNEETTDKEWDFLELNEAIKSALHRRMLANGICCAMWQKSVIFYSTMTLTNENRRLVVNLEEGEVGLLVFFSATALRLVALAEGSVRKTGDEEIEGDEGTAATAGELALATEAKKLMSQLF